MQNIKGSVSLQHYRLDREEDCGGGRTDLVQEPCTPPFTAFLLSIQMLDHDAR